MPADILTIADVPAGLLESLRRSGPAGVFYHRGLLELWERVYGWTGVVFRQDATATIGFIKPTPLGRMYYSLPFGWHGGLVGDGAGRADTRALFEWLESQDFMQENIVQFGDGLEAAYPQRYHRREHSTYILQLDGAASYSTNAVRNLKKARASGLTVGRLAAEHREAFTRLLRGHVRRTNEPRILSERFYLELFALGLRSDSGVEVRGAFVAGAPVACHVCFRTESDVYYFDGFCDQAGLDTCANFLLFDDTITGSRDRGVRRLNLGATPRGDQGLERFKVGWGAEPVNYREYERRSPVKRAVDLVRGGRAV